MFIPSNSASYYTKNGRGEDSATAHSDDATGHMVVRWGLGGGAGEGVSPVSGVCVCGGGDSNHKSSAPSDCYQFAYGLLSFRMGPSPYRPIIRRRGNLKLGTLSSLSQTSLLAGGRACGNCWWRNCPT